MADRTLIPQNGASTSDLLTALKNVVLALNGATQAYIAVNGTSSKQNITVPTVVKTSGGRIASISVIVGGSAPGTIYDSNSLNITNQPLCVIPNSVGVTFVNLPADTGILVSPGTGQAVTVSWS